MDNIDVMIAEKPGWSVAKVLEEYFAGWEKVTLSADDEEFARSYQDLVVGRETDQHLAKKCSTFTQEATAQAACPDDAPTRAIIFRIGTKPPNPPTAPEIAP
jgi:hypothetical protein